MSELTKGPWKAKRLATYQEPGWVVLWPDKGGTHMRRLDSNGNFTGPDAALIAAAPELLAAAKKVNALSIQTEAHKELRAAIAKATEHDAERQVRASDMTKLIAELAQQQADDRAHRIATMAAEELIRTEGVTTSGIDEFEIAADLLDDHMFDCVAHLCDIGAATQCDGWDGSLIVQLGDFT